MLKIYVINFNFYKIHFKLNKENQLINNFKFL